MTLQEFQSTIKYNPAMLDAFISANNIDLPGAMKKAEQLYNRRLAGVAKLRTKKEDSPELKIIKKKRVQTKKQRQASRVIKDRMQTAKSDMINHIKSMLDNNEMSVQELLADTTVYFDKQIMGSYFNNFVIRKNIVNYFEKQFIPF